MKRLIIRIKGILAGALLGGLFVGLPGSAKAQMIMHSFDGDSGPGLAVCQTGVTHCGFPDMDVAVNGSRVVQVTWQNVRVYDYKGHLLESTPLSTFMRNAGLNPIPPQHRKPAGPSVPGPFEGHVVYNEFINRWMISGTGSSDSLMVSATADPLGSWGGVNPFCLNGGPCLDFDPAVHLGYDKNGVYYCATHVGDENPNSIAGIAYDCLAISMDEISAISKGTPPAHTNRVHSLPMDVIPAIDHTRDKKPDAPALFASKTCDRSTPGACQNSMNYPFSWTVDTFTWNGSLGVWNKDGEQVVKTDVGSKQNKWLYSKPCCGPAGVFPQAGSSISLRAAESHRLTNVFQAGSHLHGVLGSGPCTAAECGLQGTDKSNVAFWFDLDCSKPSACIVSQTAKISGDFNPEFATVGVDNAGNVGIVGISSTANTNLSILLWTHRTSDKPNTLNGPTTIIAGTQPYTCEKDKGFASIANPVGVLTALDPVDGTKLWVSHQWANSAAPCVWNTRIIGFKVASAPQGDGGQPKSRKGKRQ